jgi:hypothetical protein
MQPKTAFDLATALGPAALVCGLVGFGLGLLAFESSGCNIFEDAGCTAGEGTALGMGYPTQLAAGFGVGVIGALIGFFGALIYNEVKKPKNQG